MSAGKRVGGGGRGGEGPGSPGASSGVHVDQPYIVPLNHYYSMLNSEPFLVCLG